MKRDGGEPMTLEYAAGRVRGGGGSVVSRVGEPVARGPVVVLVGLLLVAAIWRLVLAMEILAKPTLENNLGALVAWRELDVFAGAVGLLVLAAASRRWAAAATVLSAAGAVLAGLGLLMEETGAGMTVTDGFSRAGTVALVMGAAVLVLRELRAVSVRLEKAGRSGEGGVDLIDLWRVVTVQWVLVWAAAEAILRFRYSSLDLAGNPGARMLLFLLPAVGLAPNVMMWVMLGWGGRLGLYGVGKVGRPRAWVVAMLAVNVGAVLLVAWPTTAGAAGGALMAAGIGVYVLGFASAAWRGAGLGGGLVVGSFVMLGIGVLLLGATEFYGKVTGQFVSAYAAAGLRMLVYPGFVLVWLAGVGTYGLRRCVPEKWQPRQAGTVAAVLVVVAVLGTAGVFFAVGLAGPESGAFELFSATTILEVVGVGLGGAVALRGLRVARVKDGVEG